ncbi:DNA-binding protein [Candidatus Enterococcus murrayae]|uniref:DNA-binding protein n=1 Tax=Candidatus Enterococcus murrayae TaxID=2815321 RepID=A0ABS3HNQ0_9ENTE|nr:DNA-binding protein [Enterococcus sp. MJM16]MBO0455065.1 DNA-binding protein [Enterococcus sp. MJM16]
MATIDEMLIEWQKENFNKVYHTMKKALKEAKEERDVVKQKYCADYFGVSVNTLKSWVQFGCPEIRLDSGMVLYSKQAVRKWLLQYQK